MIRRAILTIILISVFLIRAGGAEPKGVEYYVDPAGVLRAPDGSEASFFGVNYTLPFAYAYRAAGYVGADRKAEIDRDVYHFARLGFNAYRVHVWDVEITDNDGNLLDNEHLDLLDYLIARLHERGIKSMITTMTTFGNGYPERNVPTEGFAYLYDKCSVHREEAAIEAQKRYVKALLEHVNPYTGARYADDEAIVAFEVNNEPCHAGEREDVRRYIETIYAAIRKTGCGKPVFYNVSHNMWAVGEYYRTPIEGTTYQWYPSGLVANRTRRGNFLPAVDRYRIPFDTLPGFDGKAKAVYEFDPADVTYSHLYPAAVRSFRTAGFQWITQFTYDPMCIAAYNTEYQTHYLNLAYTPGKALSMMIAARAARELPLYGDYGRYPADTVFGPFRVSYAEDLSEMNTAENFLYSNNTNTKPVDPMKLTMVAGCGSSPIVQYEGTGAYFLDRLADGVWRLEVMPDVVSLGDPFSRTSLDRKVAGIVWNSWPMDIDLPDLGEGFTIASVVNEAAFTAEGKCFEVTPGVWLLVARGKDVSGISVNTAMGNIFVGEFVAPEADLGGLVVVHEPPVVAEEGTGVEILATVAGAFLADSVFVRTGEERVLMVRRGGYVYRALMEAAHSGTVCYDFEVWQDGVASVYSSGEGSLYGFQIVPADSPMELLRAGKTDLWAMDVVSFPKRRVVREVVDESPAFEFSLDAGQKPAMCVIRYYVEPVIKVRKGRFAESTGLYIGIDGDMPDGSVEAGFVCDDGTTYIAKAYAGDEGMLYVPFDSLVQVPTLLIPQAYPEFMASTFEAELSLPFDLCKVESVELRVTAGPWPVNFTLSSASIK